MLDLDYKIERIENGYIITGNDSTKTKRFYPTIREFINAQIEETLCDLEFLNKTHDESGTEYEFKMLFKAN